MDILEKAEYMQTDKQKAQMIAMAQSSQRPLKERPGFLIMVDHKAHGYPDYISVPSVDKWELVER